MRRYAVKFADKIPSTTQLLPCLMNNHNCADTENHHDIPDP